MDASPRHSPPKTPLYSLTEGTNLITAYREYLLVPLVAPLVASQISPVSFRVCLAEFEAGSTPPEAFTGLEVALSDGMAARLLDLQTTPACAPVSLNVARTSTGITVSWSGDGFRLQGAETLQGPWYELGVQSPAVLPAGSALRLFRLVCD